MTTLHSKNFNLNKSSLPQVQPFFRRLQWRLTLIYALFTAVTALGLGLISLVLLWYLFFWSNWIPTRIAADLLKTGSILSPYLEQTSPDRVVLNNWLNQFMVVEDDNRAIRNPPEDRKGSDNPHTPPPPTRWGEVTAIAIVNPTGQVVVSYPAETFVIGKNLPVSAEAIAGFQAALQGITDPAELATRNAVGNIIATAPIFGSNKQLVGAIFIETTLPNQEMEYLRFTLQQTILPVVWGVLVVGGVAGVFFGYYIARDLTHRLHVLAGAADAWSNGDFDVLVLDNSGDELDQLAHRLNQMALQLQTLLQTRQGLATLEERNRLARDLHDSVKQQIFATTMQVSAALALFDENPAAAKMCLVETDRLVYQAQQELTRLIQQLRPAALEDKGLTAALREYVNDWSRQNNITAEVRVHGEQSMVLLVEQTLFRVTQEALSNIARHSSATTVKVYLVWSEGQVTLTIADNGRGFNPNTMNSNGLGLHSMRERVEAIGGYFSITSQPGTGTQVTVRCDKLPKT